ncbi:MAG TPA: multidrug effflux MFS transporter [Novosphingobium sp.]|nr:multidrug effflux MFS transporter [Novosphingobium sp.]
MLPPRSSAGEREFVFLLALMQALQALAIDAMLPAMGVMAADLGATSENRRQLVIGVFMIGIAVGSLIPGALSDRFGRRPVLFGCLGFYIVPMLACALVRDFDTLIALRFVQAVGCAGLAVIPPAIIRDRYEGDRMARLQSLVAVIFLTVPMLAPSIGQVILDLAGWRWIFGFMALLGSAVALWAWLRLPETLDPANRQPVRIGAVLGNFGTVLGSRASIGYVLASAFTMAAIWGFINSSQQLVAEHFGAGRAFPYIFGGMAAGMALANFVNSRIVERFGARRVSHAALFAYIAVGVLQVAFAFAAQQSLWQFVFAMALTMALGGFIGANFGAIALQPFARTAGAAASVQGFMRMMLASGMGMAIGQSFDGTARPYAMAVLGCGLAALGLVLFSERGRLFRRLNPPKQS